MTSQFHKESKKSANLICSACQFCVAHFSRARLLYKQIFKILIIIDINFFYTFAFILYISYLILLFLLFLSPLPLPPIHFRPSHPPPSQPALMAPIIHCPPILFQNIAVSDFIFFNAAISSILIILGFHHNFHDSCLFFIFSPDL